MKIEKKKITGDKQLSAAARSAIATALGLATAFTLNACDDSSSPGSEEPLGGDMPPEDVIPPDSADSPETTSSSSKVVDVPLSHEAVSSSVEDAVSSMMESSSSEAKPESSSSDPYGGCAPDDNECINKWLCDQNSSQCPIIHFCEDPTDPACMTVSMVTTFERDDIVG